MLTMEAGYFSQKLVGRTRIHGVITKKHEFAVRDFQTLYWEVISFSWLWLQISM